MTLGGGAEIYVEYLFWFGWGGGVVSAYRYGGSEKPSRGRGSYGFKYLEAGNGNLYKPWFCLANFSTY